MENITVAQLITPARWVEIARIFITTIIIILYAQEMLAVEFLYVAIALGLYPLVKIGLYDLIFKRKIGTEIFVTIATLIAVFDGEYIAGAVIMVIILFAEFVAGLNIDRARASIRALMGSVPQVALVRTKHGEKNVPIADIIVNDIVLVRAGEKIPIDGLIQHGSAMINEAPITGESLAKEKSIGAEVFAGTIVEDGAIDIITQKIGADTVVARIIRLVEHAEENKAKIQKIADRVAGWLIPIIFLFIIGVYIITKDLNLVITLLIFSSPAELGIATPLVIIAAIARAARNGVLIKGGIYLEALAKVDVLVFDKTGTLTENKPKVHAIKLYDIGLEESEFLQLVASANRRSAHTLAKAIVNHAVAAQLTLIEPDSFEQIIARGVKSVVKGKKILIGNQALLQENGVQVSTPEVNTADTPIYVAINGILAGVIFIADTIRPNARNVIAALKSEGVKSTYMVTGDNVRTANAVGQQVGIDVIKADLLPEDKVGVINALKEAKHIVCMVGDGINDAPALSCAHVGIAMGGSGTQVALEAADIALMADDLEKISCARNIANKAYRTIVENLLVGVGVIHVLGISAALLRLIGPIEAALLHMGPDILVFLNSVKILKVKIKDAV